LTANAKGIRTDCRFGVHGSSGSTPVRPPFEANPRGRKLVCIDLQPYTTSQAPERSDILNIGGFSDAVFDVVAVFLKDDADRFVSEIEAVEL
jgi:60 kDa SS-A/Ro ribonucleoprotein